MNNKLFARIAAAAVGVSMLATVAFAADPTLVDNTLSFKVGTEGADITISNEAQITMMAYVVGADVATTDAIPAYSDQEIIALDQVEGSTGFGDVLVEATKLEDAKKIAVLLGGSDGTVDKYLIALEGEGEDAKVTIMNGATAIDVAVVDGKATLPATAEFGKDVYEGYEFTLYSWVAVDEDDNEIVEYMAGEEVDAAALEGKTLYAKFDTGRMLGDVNGDEDITGDDYFAVKAAALETDNDSFWDEFYAGGMMFGDVTGDDDITGDDYFAVKAAALETDNDHFWENIYVVNK